MTLKELLKTPGGQILQKPSRILGEIDCIEETLETLRLQALPKGISYDKDRVQTSPKDMLPEYAAKIDEYLTIRAELNKRYFAAVDEALELIKKIDGRNEQAVLVKLYIAGKTRSEIEESLNCSTRTVQNLHVRGLEQIADLAYKTTQGVLENDESTDDRYGIGRSCQF